MKEHYIAWWNLENLFDVENSSQRPAWLQKRLKKELKGWNKQIVDTKIGQLQKIITKMNNNQGPDILGVCEVENKNVVEKLVDSLKSSGRKYTVAHHDTSDQRGIDVAFIYDSQKFTAEKQFFHVILKRSGTRDLFQVNFKTTSENMLVLVGNHWPSRSGGQYESEPYRIIAGETLSYWHERIREELNADVALLVMGDFNDEPFNRSLMQYALSTNSITRVKNARSPMFYNLMWTFLGEGLGTLYFENLPNVLDQFLVSKGLFTQKTPIKYKMNSVMIESFPDMSAKGEYPSPIRFGRPSNKLNTNGFSDHFPISVVLIEK